MAHAEKIHGAGIGGALVGGKGTAWQLSFRMRRGSQKAFVSWVFTQIIAVAKMVQR